MKILLACLIAVSSFNTFAESPLFKKLKLPLGEGLNAIYGTNDVEFITAKTRKPYVEMATGIAYITPFSNAQSNGDITKVYAFKLEEIGQVCRSEKFSQNNANSSCTGFLISEDLLMTAGHCVATLKECQSNKYVFGVNVARETNYGFEINSENVYKCRELVAARYEKDVENTKRLDFAIIRLDRKVSARHIFQLGHSSDLDNTDGNVYMLGHPMGLANTMSPRGEVVSDNGVQLRVAIDSFQGNSGSPLIDYKTNKVIGLLVSGQDDFVETKSCKKYAKYKKHESAGEGVLKIEEINSFLK